MRIKKALCILLSAVMLFTLVPSLTVSAAEIVSSLILPESETWLTRDRLDGNGEYDTSKYSRYYYGSENFVPSFYTSLTAFVGNKEVTVSDIIWKCDGDFDITKCGDYIFKIDAYDDSAYTLPQSVVDANTITVHVVDNLITKRSANFYLNCIPTRAQMVTTTAMKLFDMTGCVVLPVLNIAGMYINPNSFTAANVVLYAGESADAVTGSTHIVCDSCRLKAIYCGGNTETAVYTGDAVVDIIGTSQVGNVYCGGNSGKHIGNTVVYLSGTSVIQTAFTAGGSLCATEGAVTLNLSGYSTVDTIVKGAADSFKICTDSDYDMGKIDIISSGAEIYIDGKAADIITSVSPVSVESYVHVGTAASDISFVETSEIVVGGVKKTIPVTWKCDDYDPYTLGTYVFTMVLPDGYCFAKEAMRPTDRVTVGIRDSVSITSIEIPVGKTYLPTGVQTPEFYDALTAYASVNGHSVEVELEGLKWVSESYDCTEEGSYTFTIDPASAGEHYNISEALLSSCAVTAAVVNADGLYADGTAIFSDFPVGITKADGRYFYISDLTGCNRLEVKTGSGSEGAAVVSGKLSSEHSLKADEVKMYGGEICGIQADSLDFYGGTVKDTLSAAVLNMSDEAVLEGIIDLGSNTGSCNVNVPYRNVWQIKYPVSMSSRVTINGENMGKYAKVTSADISGSSLFCSGVPCYVDIAGDGETYLYRSNDDSLFYASPVTYKTVFGGADGSSTQNTNLVINGGILYNAFGGPNAGEVTGTAVFIQNSGTVRYYVRGAGDAKSVVANVYAEVNGGYSGKIFSLTGRESVVGSPTKEYADDEYCATLIWNGGYSREIHLANNLYAYDPSVNTVYGNTKLVMNDGVAYGIYCGMYRGTTYSDYDVTINGGIIQGELVQDSLGTASGYTRMYLYSGFPESILKIRDYSRIDICTLSDKTYSYGLGSYVTDNSVFDTSLDNGNLTFRYLELRLDSESKDTTYLPTKTGDATLVTFPDGKTMLIDTGISESGSVLVRTLKELGVTKLDYLAISHYHSDHTGGLSAVMAAFDVDTLLLPNLKVSLDATYLSSIAVFDKYPDTERVYLKAGDTMNTGGVTINIYNPDTEYEELDSYSTEEANNYSVLMKFIYGNDSALMTGDLYEAQEKALASKYTNGELDSDLLKVMHHGGFTSSYYEFYNAISPTYSVVTNTQSQRVDNQCTKYLIDNLYKTPYYYATGDNGLVKAVLTGNGITVTPQYMYGFTDVDPGAWYAPYISFASDNGLMGGTGEHSFEPSAALTRGMFVTILARLDGSDISAAASSFTDVSPSSWYSSSVAWAASNGIVGGVGDGKFEPDRKITRQEMAVMICNYLEYRGVPSSGPSGMLYEDADSVSSWAEYAVEYCTNNGILGGNEGKFLPQNTATRAEAAAIFTRLAK